VPDRKKCHISWSTSLDSPGRCAPLPDIAAAYRRHLRQIGTPGLCLQADNRSLCKMMVCRSGPAKGSVKREAGEIPALSRSGDGNEMLHGASQRTVSIEVGSGNRVGCPESEDRPAATTMEALAADCGCA